MSEPLAPPRSDVALDQPGTAGLTGAEAELRRRRGEGNRAVSASSRSYGRILRTNVFNFYNSILFVIGAALLALGRYSDAVISVSIGLLNAVISAVQEIRAKRQLDRLQLLGRSGVVVVRDGRDVEVSPEEVVRGDVLRVRPGDQVVVDGPVLDGVIEVDESLLTGESDAQLRHPEEDLLSGSHCVSGGGLLLARDVGAASYANRLTADARRAKTDTTPLQRQIAFCVRLVMAVVVVMSGAILLQAELEGMSLVRVVQTTAVLSGLVPYGLFFLIVLAYTAGAVASSRRGALVQRVNAVESVSNVDVICTDKTGTLTTGRLTVTEVVPLGGHDADAVSTALGAMVRSTGAVNLTSSALAAALPGRAEPALEEVAFSSSLRWSAVRTDGATWVLGAPEALAGHLQGPDVTADVRARTRQGLRVLVFAAALDPAAALRTADGVPTLPALEPLAVVALADEIRAGVPATLARFGEEGIAVKVLSGDDPDTVGALASRAGLNGADPVHGAQLDDLSDPELDALVGRTVAFGRVAPEQKERIVVALRRQGRYVAMVGDGVNDARALKAAHVGVAMRSGSAVARDVADIVLVEDSLDALLPTRTEGRRIISGIALSAQIFLTRVATQALIIVTVTMLGLGFPYSPAQTGLTLFTVGLPTIFLTAWARPTAPDRHLLLSLARFVLPATVLTAAFAVAVYAFLFTTITRGFNDPDIADMLIVEFTKYTGLTYGVDADFTEAAATIGAQTGLSTFVSLASVLLILFLEPPTRLFAAWTRPSPDKRPAVLVVVLLAGLLAALMVPTLRDYFGLTRPVGIVYQTAVPALVLWFVALAGAYRFHLFDRILGLPDLLGRTGRAAARRATRPDPPWPARSAPPGGGDHRYGDGHGFLVTLDEVWAARSRLRPGSRHCGTPPGRTETDAAWPGAPLVAALPDLDFALNPGASEAQLQEVETELGFELPRDVREVYLRHDGQAPSAPGLLAGRPLLSLAGAIDEWRVWASIDVDMSGIDSLSEPAGAVREVYLDAGWFPLCIDGGGNNLGVDCDPGPSGRRGQVINFGRDEEVKYAYAPSLTAFLARLAELAAGGRAVVERDGDRAWWGIDDAQEQWPRYRDFTSSPRDDDADQSWYAALEPAWQQRVGGPGRVSDFLGALTFSSFASDRTLGQVQSLEPLGRAANLRKVVIHTRVLEALTQLPALPLLATLYVSTRSHAGIDRFPALESYHLVKGAPAADLAPLATAARLRELALPGVPHPDLTPLQACANLTSLVVRAADVDQLRQVTRLSALRQLDLDLSDVSEPADRLDWSGLAGLRQLRVQLGEADTLDFLDQLPNLTTVTISGLRGTDVAAVGGMPRVESVTFESSRDLVNVEAVAGAVTLREFSAGFEAFDLLKDLRPDLSFSSMEGDLTREQKQKWRSWAPTPQPEAVVRPGSPEGGQ